MDGALCPIVRTPSPPYNANNAMSREGNTLDVVLGEDTETATLAWLVSSLEHACTRGQTKLVDYLEAVVEDVVFEMEAAARRRGHM
jgi:hypothetical protein